MDSFRKRSAFIRYSHSVLDRTRKLGKELVGYVFGDGRIIHSRPVEMHVVGADAELLLDDVCLDLHFLYSVGADAVCYLLETAILHAHYVVIPIQHSVFVGEHAADDNSRKQH